MKSAARVNDASDCTYEQAIMTPGTFRNCRMGTYTRGRRTGQSCVVKFFRNPGQNEDEYFRTEAAVVKKAVELVTSWNGQVEDIRPIRINYPEVWTNSGGKRYTVEPFIAYFQKFNSNSGWSADDSGWNEVMQALSHYTFHVTRGHFVLCDLQGGIYRDSTVLTDPVIMSRSAGQFGPTDLGPRGIDNFFYHHQCNQYCDYSWQRPRSQRPSFRAVQGTTMRTN